MIKFKIWRVTILKSLLQLKQFGMDFQFSRNKRFTTFALRWDDVYVANNNGGDAQADLRL